MALRLKHRRANRTVAMVVAAGGLVVLAAIMPAVLSGSADPAPQQNGYYFAETLANTVTPPPPSWTPDTFQNLPEIPTDLPGTPASPPDITTTEAPAPSTEANTDARADTRAETGSELRTLAAADLPVLRAGIEGRWVAQLGSKRTGMTVGGTHYDDATILADHRTLRETYSDVRLAWSGDWATFSAADFWVTLVATPFATAEEANGWCDSHGIAKGECYAKRVSVTGGYAGNTVPR
jgi:hypothetical protein